MEKRKHFILQRIKNVLYEYSTIDTETKIKNIIEYILYELEEEFKEDEETKQAIEELKIEIENLKDDVTKLYEKY